MPASNNKLILLAILLFSTFPVLAQQTNPLENDPRAAYAGGVIFRAQCATCHGADAKGISSIDAPDLTLMWAGRELADYDVFQTIRQGIPGSIMPPHGFPDPEVWMLVSYLKSIAVTGTSRELRGDAERGRVAFAESCQRCHRVAGRGGSLGPDLSRITSRRSYDSILQSIREPGAAVGRGYRVVRIADANGQAVLGTVKSEDAFSIQIMDDTQRLRGFDKRAVQDISPQQNNSLMPAFTPAQLSDSDIENILTYLQAQR